MAGADDGISGVGEEAGEGDAVTIRAEGEACGSE